MADAWG
jgi:hypothetical protein